MTSPDEAEDPIAGGLVEVFRDPASGMDVLAMREWPPELGTPPAAMIAAAEKREGRKWATERRRGPKTPKPDPTP